MLHNKKPLLSLTQTEVAIFHYLCVQVQSRLPVMCAIRTSARRATVAVTSVHICMPGTIQVRRQDDRCANSRWQMLQCWMRYSCRSQYRSLTKVSTSTDVDVVLLSYHMAVIWVLLLILYTEFLGDILCI